MKKLLQLLTLLLILLTACALVEQQMLVEQVTVPEPLVSVIPYVNKDFGFTFLIPSNWNETEILNTAVAFLLPAKEENKPVVTLSLELQSRLLTLEEYTKVVLANLPVRYPDAKVLEITDTMFANQSAKQLTYTATISNIPVKVTSTFITSLDNPVAMSFVYLSPINSYEVHKKSVMQAVASFVFTETESKLEIPSPPAGSAAEAYVEYYAKLDKIRKIEQFNELITVMQQHYTRAGFTEKFREFAAEEQKTRELLRKVPSDIKQDILETLQAAREAFFVDYELNPPLFAFIDIKETTKSKTESELQVKARQRFPAGITRTFILNAKMQKEDGKWKVQDESEWEEMK